MQYDWGWNRRDQETLTGSIRCSGLSSSGGCGGGAAITVGDGDDVGFDHIHLQLGRQLKLDGAGLSHPGPHNSPITSSRHRIRATLGVLVAAER